MPDHYATLTGPQQAQFWVALSSVLIGVASVLVQAAIKCPPRLGPSLAFRTAFVVVFARIAYRLLGGGQLGYGSVALYATPGLAAAWTLWDCMRGRGV